jgi:hypothetical protein
MSQPLQFRIRTGATGNGRPANSTTDKWVLFCKFSATRQTARNPRLRVSRGISGSHAARLPCATALTPCPSLTRVYDDELQLRRVHLFRYLEQLCFLSFGSSSYATDCEVSFMGSSRPPFRTTANKFQLTHPPLGYRDLALRQSVHQAVLGIRIAPRTVGG